MTKKPKYLETVPHYQLARELSVLRFRTPNPTLSSPSYVTWSNM